MIYTFSYVEEYEISEPFLYGSEISEPFLYGSEISEPFVWI